MKEEESTSNSQEPPEIDVRLLNELSRISNSLNEFKEVQKLSKTSLEEEKLRLEISKLKQPQWISQLPGFAAVSVAVFSIIMAIYSGFFEKERLLFQKKMVEFQIEELKAQKEEEKVKNDSIASFYQHLNQLNIEKENAIESYNNMVESKSDSISDLMLRLNQNALKAKTVFLQKAEVEKQKNDLNKLTEIQFSEINRLDSIQDNLLKRINSLNQQLANAQLLVGNKNDELFKLKETIKIYESQRKIDFELENSIVNSDSFSQNGFLSLGIVNRIEFLDACIGVR